MTMHICICGQEWLMCLWGSCVAVCGYVYFGLGNSIWDHVCVWMTVWLCHRMGGVVVNWASDHLSSPGLALFQLWHSGSQPSCVQEATGCRI